MQHAVPALESLSIDQAALAAPPRPADRGAHRGRLRTLAPDGTFYLFSRWADGSPEEIWDRLADRDVFVMPGSILAAPEHFRISLTASDAMIDKALPAFAEAREAAAVRAR